MDQVAIVIPRPQAREGSAFTATAYFRDRATAAASTPTNVYYRLDCLTTLKVLADWTSASPSTSISVPVTATHNAIHDQSNHSETKQLTVSADHGLATQVRETAVWSVGNIHGF